MQDTGVHVPNLVCATTSNSDELYRFEGTTCIENFLDWLRELALEFQLTVLAHNSQSFDSYLILGVQLDNKLFSFPSHLETYPVRRNKVELVWYLQFLLHKATRSIATIAREPFFLSDHLNYMLSGILC